MKGKKTVNFKGDHENKRSQVRKLTIVKWEVIRRRHQMLDGTERETL